MSSPTVSTFQSGRVGTSIARLVLPQAEGKAPPTNLTLPSGEVSLRISMCSASQPSRSEEHTSELQSHSDLVCRLLLEKKKKKNKKNKTKKKKKNKKHKTSKNKQL